MTSNTTRSTRRAPARALAVVAVTTLLTLSACGEEPPPPEQPPRSVTVVTLTETDPPSGRLLAGTVESWKREEMGFRVPGRVEWIVDPGTDIVGRTFDERGEPISEGTVIARLVDDKLEIARDESKAALASVTAALETARTELEQRIPAEIKEARAQVTLQEKERQRYTKLVAERAAGQEQLDTVIAAHRTAEARLAQSEADLASKASEVRTLEAEVVRAKQALALAEVNLADCDLVSPFTGQVARVHTYPGAYVMGGMPAVTVQMMDPMQVLVSVSSKTDDLVTYNDRLRVHVDGLDEPLEGLVYLKDTFADPATRTYLITVLVRNQFVEVDLTPEQAASGLPRTDRLFDLQRHETDDGTVWGVEVGALREDAEGFYVWRVTNLDRRELFQSLTTELSVEKMRVVPGESRASFIGLFTFRTLDDIGGLDPESAVILGSVDGEVGEEGKVLLRRRRWQLRPGDIARVELSGRATERGWYVPEGCIRADGDAHVVAVAEPMDDGTHTIRTVRVAVGAVAGGVQQIRSDEGAELAEGASIVLEGAQYVRDGMSVAPVRDPRFAR